MYSIRELEQYVEKYLESELSGSMHRLAARIILDGFIRWLKKQEGKNGNG